MEAAELVKKLRDYSRASGPEASHVLGQAAAILERLPVTADGVLVTPGMQIWTVLQTREGPRLGLSWASIYDSDEAPETADAASKHAAAEWYAKRENAAKRMESPA